MSELKCCRICGAFLTCDRKGECCPECQYFDESDMLCLAPDALKKQAKKAKVVVVEEDVEDDDVDPETFLFEDDDEDEDDTDKSDDDTTREDLEIEDVEW
ncbi:MAG: hypothetical protein KAR33_13195 [Candidatus Thorarchaeota archaeon]|nr:hypothetical protein [Candidatus Thorarchaeota archaeon]